MLNDRICFQSARNKGSISRRVKHCAKHWPSVCWWLGCCRCGNAGCFDCNIIRFNVFSSSWVHRAVLFADIECMLCKYSRRSFFFCGNEFLRKMFFSFYHRAIIICIFIFLGLFAEMFLSFLLLLASIVLVCTALQLQL